MKYLKNKILWIVVVVTTVVLIVINSFLNKNGIETVTVQRSDLNQSVTVSGKVVPSQEVNLSFELAGIIDSVSVDVGDEVVAGQVLARLDSSEILNEVSESQASLDSELAKLNELTSGSSDESQTISSQQQLLSVLKKAYVTGDDIIRNKVDVFFTDPDSRFPEFNKSLSNYFLRQEINQERFRVASILEEWETYNTSLLASDVALVDAEYNINNLKEIQTILELISDGAVEFSPTSQITQNQIDAYITTISSARTSVSSLIVEINQTAESLRDVRSNIPVQQAAVRNAEANLQRLNSRTNKYILVAPFDGVITAREIEPGEVSEIGRTALSIIGDGVLEIETFIPEVLIAGVDVSDSGKATLDAFGDLQKFDVFVAHVDPRETEKDGLTTYRTLIDFSVTNNQIRPGMTAVVEIIKQQIPDTIVLPTHLVQEDSSGFYVEVANGRQKERRAVELGISDGKGSVAVVSGLSEGEEVVVPEQK